MPATVPPASLLRRGLAMFRREVALSRATFLAALGGAVLYAFGLVGTSWAIGHVVDTVVTPRFEDGHVATGTAVAGALLIVAAGVAKAAGIVTRRTFATITRYNAGAELRRQVIGRFQSMPLAYHRAQPTGELLANAHADPDAATEALAPLPYATGVCTLLLLSVVWLLLTDVVLAVVGLLLVPALLILNAVYQRRVEGPAARAQNHLGGVSAIAHESFDGAFVVKTLGAEAGETARFAHESERLRDARVEAETLHATFEAVLDALPALANVGLLLLGAWRVDRGAITIGTLVAFVNLLSLMTLPLRMIGYLLGDLSRSVVAFDRVDRVLAVEPPPPPSGTASLPEGPLDVRVAGLRFGYEPGAPVLHDVSFTVSPGTTVALVGPTGSGKSTLLLLLARLLDGYAGSIRIGGADVAHVSIDDLAADVGLAFQDTFLFGDSVAENIGLGSAEADELVDAATTARAHDFVSRLPSGYATVLGERGATLSGGQRQRVALARALVRRPRLLLLDEATSSVDPSTEAEILAALDHRLAGTTTVLVASRPSTIAVADRVLFLDGGRLVAEGTHEELVASRPGYAKLIQAYETERSEGAA